MKATYRCGHPRTRENTWGRKSQNRCKQCRQAYKRGELPKRVPLGDGITTFKRCGHEKSRENTWKMGAYRVCKCCRQATRRKHTVKKAAERVAFIPTVRRSALDLSEDPSVQLYRQEKERRVARQPAAYWQGAA